MLCFRFVQKHLFNASLLRRGTRLTAAASSSSTNDIGGGQPKTQDDVHIVIVGGGLAGLSAAHHLLKHGFRNTVILEATDRYGGRISTRRFGDTFCELGAKWIAMDVTRHSVYELLHQAAAATGGVRKQMSGQADEVMYMNTAGERLDGCVPQTVDQLFRKLCRLDISLKDKLDAGELDAGELNSVHSYLQAEAKKELKTLFQGQEQMLAHDVFTALCNEYSGLLGCCLEHVNIEHITTPSTGAAAIYIPSGLNNLLHQLAAELDDSRVRTGKPVGQIVWYSTDDAETRETKAVACIDGSLFVADHIICTLPLGVLKTFSPHIFKPTLPADKQQAIRRLGFGSPVKIYLEYKRNVRSWFWPSKESSDGSDSPESRQGHRIRPIWSASERRGDPAWRKQVAEIGPVPASNRVLEVTIGGAFHEHIEKLPDDEVARGVTQLLRDCLQNPRIPEPTSLLRSNWSSCACYLGGRPYMAVGSSAQDVHTLAAPLGGSGLLFAGDATSVLGFGTLDGARSSGIREAQRIVDLYQPSSESAFTAGRMGW